MKKRNINVSGFFYHFMLMLFCFVSLTSFISFNYVGRYSKDKVGDDKASIAGFVIDVIANTKNNLEINFNDYETTASYNFSVTNSKNDKIAEVATEYDIVVSAEDSIPDGISLMVDNIEPTINGNSYVFSNVGKFSPSVLETKQHTLTFIADTNIITEDLNISNISINVIAKQAAMGGGNN